MCRESTHSMVVQRSCAGWHSIQMHHSTCQEVAHPSCTNLQLAAETCEFSAETCEFSAETCEFSAETCEFSAETCEFSAETCEFSQKKDFNRSSDFLVIN